MTLELSTAAECSGYRITGRYDEVGPLCAAFAQRWPQAARAFDFGRTPEGRPLHALAVSLSGALTPEAARERGLPVLLVQGGIHPGECDGKDAGFAELRDLLLADSVWPFATHADQHRSARCCTHGLALFSSTRDTSRQRVDSDASARCFDFPKSRLLLFGDSPR